MIVRATGTGSPKLKHGSADAARQSSQRTLDASAVTLDVRCRRWAMTQALLAFHSKHTPRSPIERLVWWSLLEWARLGGTADEVVA